MHARPDAPCATRYFILWSLAALLAIMAWDASGLDLPLARWFGNARGFALMHHWWLQNLLHDGVRLVSWALVALLVLAIWWPMGPLRALPRGSRVGMVIGMLLAALAVQGLKRISYTSCPWSLAEFGGAAAYVSHWQWGVRDGGSGHCFPAGHASVAFSYLGAWFWLRPWAPRLARGWLIATLLAGLVFGTVQMARGAHYLSHVLWAGWVCWVVGGAWWLGAKRRLA